MTKNKFVTLYYPILIRNANNNVQIPVGGVYEPNYDNLKKNHDNLKKNPDNSKKKNLRGWYKYVLNTYFKKIPKITKKLIHF